MSHIRYIHNLLLAGGTKLPSILINMSAVKGLRSGYGPSKKEFALASSLFTSLDLEGIKIKCATYTSVAAAITHDTDMYMPHLERPPSPKLRRPSQLRCPRLTSLPSLPQGPHKV